MKLSYEVDNEDIEAIGVILWLSRVRMWLSKEKERWIQNLGSE